MGTQSCLNDQDDVLDITHVSNSIIGSSNLSISKVYRVDKILLISGRISALLRKVTRPIHSYSKTALDPE